MNKHVFALDIGTQSVTGILLNKQNKKYKVIDYCVKKHSERSMLDGQIQNVVQVAEIITKVKQELEEKHGPLKKVCVAAAGRALKTIQAEQSINIKEQPITTEEEITHLELSAVQRAQMLLTKDNKYHFANYHCVGYSVLHYKLDGEKIGSFIDQIGSEATVEIIATFLPKIVVESLLAALERANLTMEALTLEPIAAIHVLVPESMRRLNVALIDIGAGTSDIAISNDGSVIAYGMVPVAGDEITESISDHYLLDFKKAEETKRTIVNDKSASVQDILGFDVKITYDELVPNITESVDHLAKLLADEIRNLNSKSPQAVMLIGGGSLTPRINEKLASYLQLPTNRVAVRGVDAISLLENNEELPTGPDFVTPIGIAISATQNPLHYITVYVNDKITLMFKTKQLTVGDCLIQAGIEINKYYGKIGLASIVTVNGENMTIRGEYGEAPIIFVNDQKATVNSPIQQGDKITIHKGKDGRSPSVSIEEIVGKISDLPIYFNDEEIVVHPTYLVNNEKVDSNYIVQDKDHIVTKMPSTVEEFLSYINYKNLQNHFYVTINKRKVAITKGKTQLLLNNEPTRLTTTLNRNDRLQIITPEKVKVKTLLDQLNKQYYNTIEITFNGKPVQVKQQIMEVKRQDHILSLDSTLEENDELTLTSRKQQSFIFQDVFRYVDIDLSQTKGNYSLYKNKKPSSFHDEIMSGDQLEIRWEDFE